MSLASSEKLPMTRSIRAAVLRRPQGEFEIEPVRLANPGPDEVLVEMVATGICHTDLAVVHQQFALPPPIVLGHEGAGVVRQVGSAVTRLTPGDHVVLTYGSCGACRNCASDHSAYCSQFPALNFSGRRADGTPSLSDKQDLPLFGSFFGQSSFATEAVASQRNVVKVRRDAPLKMLGPLGCGFMTGAGTILHALRPNNSSTVAIYGAGAVGFAALFAARLSGCQRVIVVDRVQTRLALAREFGASEVINTDREDLDAALKQIGGVDVAIDTTGVPTVIEAAVRALSVRGALALVGASAETTIRADVVHLISGRSVFGVIEGDSNPFTFIPYLIEKFLNREFPIDRLCDFFDFDDINQAVAAGKNGTTIKPILLFS